MTTRREMMALLEKLMEKLENGDLTAEEGDKLDETVKSMLKKIEEQQAIKTRRFE